MCCTSCSDSDPAPTPEEDETVSLIATLENERLWESGDEVLINGMKYTVEEGVGSAAATIKVPRAEHYYAAYDTGTGTVTENILSSEFTSTQNVSADMARPNHYQRIGEFEAAEIIVNRTEHIIVEPLASGKHTEVNPMGFTIVVEEVGHNPNHSYYDYK